MSEIFLPLIPAQAGIQRGWVVSPWVPACAGTSGESEHR